METEVAVFTKDPISHGSAGGCSGAHRIQRRMVREGAFSQMVMEGGWLCRLWGCQERAHLAWMLAWIGEFFFNKFFFKFIFCCVGSSFAARGLSLVAARGGYSSLRCMGFSLWWLLLLRSTGSRCSGFSSCGMWAQ